MVILFDLEDLDKYRAQQSSELERLKLALVSNNPERMSTLFPQYAAPEQPAVSTAIEIDRGLATHAPMTIDTVMTPDEALEFMRTNSLSLDEMDVGQDI